MYKYILWDIIGCAPPVWRLMQCMGQPNVAEGFRERGPWTSHAPELDPYVSFGRPQATVATLVRGLQPLVVSPARPPPACA
jgi:hypothetical protein